MISDKKRRRALARAKWERQQARRTASESRARIMRIVGGVAVSVVVIIFAGWGVVHLVQNSGPGSTAPSNPFPSFLTPTDPGLDVTSFNPGTPTVPTTAPATGKTTGTATGNTAPTPPTTTGATGKAN